MRLPPRLRPLPLLVLLAASALLAGLLLAPLAARARGQAFLGIRSTKAAAGAESDAVEEAPRGGPLDWLHYDVIIASHQGYPVALMIGFCGFGNVLLRKECEGKPYPNWLFGYILCFVCYTYPGAIMSDLVFVNTTPRPMGSDNCFIVYTLWFVVIQTCEPVYKFLTNKHVFVMLTTWWLADAQRAAFCFLERTVAYQPAFSRGVFQAFVWCSAGPILRAGETVIRGAKVAPLDKVQPNTFNPLKYPLVAMFMLMILYMLYMQFLTDCHIFDKSRGRNMVECGKQNDDVFAAFTYVACILHIGRSYWNIYGLGDGKAIFSHCMCGT